jgi:hypothetical protein
MASMGVKWEFIIEKAPWQGGFYEGMIQNTKRCLKKALGRSSMDFESLRTLLVEIETTINNRPLTYVYDDVESISYPLTPSQLVYGRQLSLTPSDRQFNIISTNRSLTKRAKNQSRLLDTLTNRWRTEYLLSTSWAWKGNHWCWGPTFDTPGVAIKSWCGRRWPTSLPWRNRWRKI